MKRSGPLLTLLAVAVLGAVLFVVNMTGDPANAPAPAAAAAPAAAPTSAAAAPASVAPAVPAPEPPAVAEKAYTGRSSGNEVTVAIAVKDGKAAGYICDGKKVEAWLEGTVVGKDVSLKSADGSATITGTVDDKESLGDVAVAGKQWPYAAKGVIAPAGLYQGRADVRGVANRVGWIVLNDGGQTGILRPAGGEPQPAPVLNPANPGAVTIDGVPVTVTEIGGADKVVGS